MIIGHPYQASKTQVFQFVRVPMGWVPSTYYLLQYKINMKTINTCKL